MMLETDHEKVHQYRASLMHAEAFEYYWPTIKCALNETRELWSDSFTLDNIFDRVHSFDIQPWVVFDEGEIQILILTQKVPQPNGTAVFEIIWMWGERLKEVMDLLEMAMNDFAIKMECDRIEARCRPGFERLLAGLGVQKRYSILSRPVIKVREN